MDIDIIRDQKLGAGAGMRSNKVSGCACAAAVVVVAKQIALWENIALLLEAKSIANHYITCEPACGTRARMTETHRSVCFGGTRDEICRGPV